MIPHQVALTDTKPRLTQSNFKLTLFARRAIITTALLAAFVRLILALAAANLTGNLGQLTTYGFTVVFPLVLIGLLLSLGPGRTREGVLMRIGTACQMILVILVPPLALHLVLGLPIVFLLVELFETRMPAKLREFVAARWVQR
ncbi:MAG: hypothetical protein ACRYHQ_26270 [Janthinobacterium lividum]